jgi:TolB-like protein/Tfp pilus assembly protein PilF
MPSRLRFGDVEIDLEAFELRRGGALTAVEPQVFELVSHLARNPGRLVTKDELIETVWHGRIVSDATLASRIKSARRAIGDDGEQQKWIKTVHGRGVRFVGEVAHDTAAGAPDLAAADSVGRPAIAILPFETLGGTNDRAATDESFFADGVAEEITAALSRMRSLIVIARSSTQRYRKQPVSLAQVARDLGVRYVVLGSVRRADGTVRINARLVEAATGTQIWASHYDGKLEDVFALEDRITGQVIAAIAPTIRSVEIERARRKRPDSMEAYDYIMRALPQVWALTEDGGMEALALTQRAIALEPNYALAYALGAWCHFWQFVNGWPADLEATRVEGLRLARAALRLDNEDPDVLAMVGAAEATLGRNLDYAAALIDKALTIDPNSAWAWIRGGYCHVYRGQDALALQYFERAEKLSPFDPLNFNRHVGVAMAHFIAGRYELAVEAAAKALLERPHLTWGHRVIAAAYGQLGWRAEGTAAVEKVRHYSPGATVTSVMHVMALESEELRGRFAEGLRRAGLPDGENTADARPSVAVLPFLAISEEGDEGNLADGLTEDIITDLSRVSGLFVMARNAVSVYRGKPVRVQQAAQALGVRYVLEGSVRAAGDSVRITVQLIDGKTEGQVWAERYDRALTDILALQDEIARSVAEALKVRLLPEELAAIARRPTADPEAYQYYLLGRSFFLRSGWGQRAMKVARQMFVKAVAVDPRYARAYAAIANCDSYLLCMGDPSTSFETILAQCALALELEPDLADAHAAKGLALFTAGRAAEAEAELDRAMTLAPDSFEAYFFAGRCQRARGDHARAAILFERAGELQPDDFRALGLAAQSYRSLGRDEPARAAARRCLERIEGELAIHADDAKALAFGAAVLADLGQGERALEWAERAAALNPDDLITSYQLACVWVALARPDAALTLLERIAAVPADARQLHLDWMKHDKALDPLRNHPRYRALVRHLEGDG